MIKHKDWIKIYLIFLLAFSIQFLVSIAINHWHFAYPLDDPYIHLAIAKNFAGYGIWGPTKFEFASASSSILYTLILSFFFLIGIKTIYFALVLNLFSAGLLFFVIYKIARKEEWQRKTYYMLCVLFILFVPLISLALTGMEHILHATAILLLLYYSSVSLSKPKCHFERSEESGFLFSIFNFLSSIFCSRHSEQSEESLTKNVILNPSIIQDKLREESQTESLKTITLLSLFTMLAVSLRYETIFAVFIIAILFFIRKRYRQMLIITFSAILPLAIFGIISINNGSYFFPNTLLTKAPLPDLSIGAILNQSVLWLERMFRYPHLLTCLILMFFNIIFAGKGKRNLDNKWFVFSMISIASLILHLTFAGVVF